jgi:hypothetical protein
MANRKLLLTCSVHPDILERLEIYIADVRKTGIPLSRNAAVGVVMAKGLDALGVELDKGAGEVES